MKAINFVPALLLVFLTACQTTGLGTTVFNPLKFRPAVAEEESVLIETVLRSKSEFMVDKRGETTTVKGQALKAGYNDYYGKVVVYIGYDYDVATLQGSIFSGVKPAQSREAADRYFRRGGVACVLNNKNHEKLALKLPYGERMSVKGKVYELKNGWIYMDECRFTDGKASPEFKNPPNLDFIAGRWCALSTGFMNRNVQWKVDYRKVEDNKFQANYLYAATYGDGWQNKGIETFERDGKTLTRTNDAGFAGRFTINDKTSMSYYPNAEDNENYHMFLKCQ
ncbi:hypothetical protein [Kordiimonas pumila]|uniref:Uncharacterized protein n=1 Tax=Kordiimonas pumila TaxID=2161677 RepID=A0ABV7D5I6_9PROT|nr:hypothetical protein [Kordiimonas pumila]